MAKTYKIGNKKEYVIVTKDDSGAYIIKDMAGRKVFLSRFQARLMKIGINEVLKKEFEGVDSSDVTVEEIKEGKD
jgi:hypothetical protein